MYYRDVKVQDKRLQNGNELAWLACVINHPIPSALLGGSWGLISRVISKVSIVITHIRGRITPPITTHEPPSTSLNH